jgi:hypothetical protein
MGTGVTQDQQAVVQAALGDAALAGAIAKLLKKVGNDPAALEGYLKSHLENANATLPKVPALTRAFQTLRTLTYGTFAARDGSKSHQGNAIATLPKVPALTEEFKTLLTLTHGTFAARTGVHSTYEFQLTLTGVEPGKTQEKLEALVEEMHAQFPKMKNYPEFGFRVNLSGNRDLLNYTERGDITFTCSSILKDSTNRHWSEEIPYKGKRRSSQKAFLAELGLQEQPVDIVRVMGALWWLVQKEFPTEQEMMGCLKKDSGDPRDPFEGRVARTKKGSSYDSAASFRDGVYDYHHTIYAFPFDRVGAVGGPRPQFIKRDR